MTDKDLKEIEKLKTRIENLERSLSIVSKLLHIMIKRQEVLDLKIAMISQMVVELEKALLGEEVEFKSQKTYDAVTKLLRELLRDLKDLESSIR